MDEPKDILDRATRDALLHRMVEGLHALIYGTYTVGSGDYALKALGDGGSIHEYVHGMLWLLPPRCYEQVESGGERPVAGVKACDVDRFTSRVCERGTLGCTVAHSVTLSDSKTQEPS